MISRIGTLLRTIRFIKPVQIFYQLKNRVIKVKSLNQYKIHAEVNPVPLSLIPDLRNSSAAGTNGLFIFLNLPHEFPERIDWNFSDHGKLWNYNLQYLDYIFQEDIPLNTRLSWIRSIYSCLNSGELKPEPYPASLRAMNLIRLFSTNPSLISDYPDIQSDLYAELSYLHEHYEYHLLGNHLLENAFCMLMGGYYFQKTDWKKRAEDVLLKQLNEQILSDGAHFELSPMYHQIMLFRVMEAISFLNVNNTLYGFLRVKAEKMLGWLTQMSFSNGDIPHFNDSTDGIALRVDQLQKLAHLLNLDTSKIKFFDSGYRKFTEGNIEMIADVHGISPTYQPGHAHADHLSFVLYSKGKPFIVDPGTSTYTISERRNWERSSMAHNTVTVNSMNQSEVWSGFRVGRRAKVNIIDDHENLIKASVEYSGVSHIRTFISDSSSLIIEDEVRASGSVALRFYLHPYVVIKQQQDSEIQFISGEIIRFENSSKIQVSEYDFAVGFNKLEKSKYIEVFFKGNCKSFIFTG
jgi:hypothetical protein